MADSLGDPSQVYMRAVYGEVTMIFEAGPVESKEPDRMLDGLVREPTVAIRINDRTSKQSGISPDTSGSPPPRNSAMVRL
jgi:hypothetical protein